MTPQTKLRIVGCAVMVFFGLKAGFHTARVFQGDGWLFVALMILYPLFGVVLLLRTTPQDNPPSKRAGFGQHGEDKHGLH
jgi:hypothetical protein